MEMNGWTETVHMGWRIEHLSACMEREGASIAAQPTATAAHKKKAPFYTWTCLCGEHIWASADTYRPALHRCKSCVNYRVRGWHGKKKSSRCSIRVKSLESKWLAVRAALRVAVVPVKRTGSHPVTRKRGLRRPLVAGLRHGGGPASRAGLRAPS